MSEAAPNWKSGNSENVVWSGKPTNWINFPTYLFCLLFALAIAGGVYYLQQNPAKVGKESIPVYLYFLAGAPLLIALFKRWTLKSTSYRLTNQRFFVDEGILSRKSEELELYRVKDITVVRPFFLRIVGRGNIILHTSDQTNPKVHVLGIKNIEVVRDDIRNLVEHLRKEKGVREVDRGVGDHDVI